MSSFLSQWRKSIASLTLIAFSTQITGCLPHPTDAIENPFSDLVQFLKTEEQQKALPDSSLRATWARLLDKAVHSAQEEFEHLPSIGGRLTAQPEEARQFVAANQPKLNSWADRIDQKSEAVRKLIYDISKHAYENRNDLEISRDYSLLFFALQYQRVLYKQMIQGFSALALAAGTPELKDVSEVTEFKKQMLSRYFAYVGLEVVIQKDLKKTAQVLKKYKKSGELPAPMWKFIKESRDAVVAQAKEEMQPVSQALDQLPAENRAQLQAQLKGFEASFNGVSLLYSSLSNASTTFNILSWVGNLTWGLVNTLIGAGIVFTTMLVSPFTPYVDFPTFRISASGSQIYVDVTGMSPRAGKMSMGLFELDNASGFYFASNHEGAHAVQSAILGPLYLPLILGSYMVSGFDRGFMEDWAWAWAGD